MILDNLKMAGTDEPVSIAVTGTKITNIAAASDSADTGKISLDNALVFPGLINSHDHLDFNLFPRFGNKTYSNYTEWGKHIHKSYKSEIDAVLKVPVALRSEWGVFKNLLCGVTTVVNHGEPSGLKEELLSIFEETQCLHSVHFQKGWKFKLNSPFGAKIPVNIHVGEGDDWLAFKEIDQLTNWNFFKRKLIGVHGVAMSESQAKKFEALVWCPESNFYLLDKTASIDILKDHTNILFGTDSTLTGGWNIWEHLRLARRTKLLSDAALYDTLNKNAAKAWKLNCGELKTGADADLVVARIKKGTTGFQSFFMTDPADLLLVIHRGNIRLFDETMLAKLVDIDIKNYSKVYVNDVCKYVQGKLPALMAQITEYYPQASFPVITTQPD